MRIFSSLEKAAIVDFPAGNISAPSAGGNHVSLGQFVRMVLEVRCEWICIDEYSLLSSPRCAVA
jgi:hypothetical protein